MYAYTSTQEQVLISRYVGKRESMRTARGWCEGGGIDSGEDMKRRDGWERQQSRSCYRMDMAFCNKYTLPQVNDEYVKNVISIISYHMPILNNPLSSFDIHPISPHLLTLCLRHTLTRLLGQHDLSNHERDDSLRNHPSSHGNDNDPPNRRYQRPRKHV